MQKTHIIAVDFDGTLCENKYPEIGRPYPTVIKYIVDRQKLGSKIILWTCRNNKRLEEAVDWCKEHGLIFDAVNENLPEILEAFGGVDSRKITATEYIDDRNKDISRLFRSDWDSMVQIEQDYITRGLYE